MELDNPNLKKESANEKRARLDKKTQRAQELRRAETNKKGKPALKKEMKRTGLNAKQKVL